MRYPCTKGDTKPTDIPTQKKFLVTHILLMLTLSLPEGLQKVKVWYLEATYTKRLTKRSCSGWWKTSRSGEGYRHGSLSHCGGLVWRVHMHPPSFPNNSGSAPSSLGSLLIADGKRRKSRRPIDRQTEGWLDKEYATYQTGQVLLDEVNLLPYLHALQTSDWTGSVCKIWGRSCIACVRSISTRKTQKQWWEVQVAARLSCGKALWVYICMRCMRHTCSGVGRQYH